MKKICNILCAFASFAVLLGLVNLIAFAKENTTALMKDDIFTYMVADDKVTITDIDDARKIVVIPDKLDKYPVVAIDSGACAGSSVIDTIYIPDSVKEIGSMCFSYSTSLTNVQLPDGLKKIEDGLFTQCTKLRNITIPSSVKEIGKDAFYRCDELWTITLPDGLTSIGNNAFLACPNLSAATIPASVTYIANDAFEVANGFRIYAKPNTKGHTFALEKGITFEEYITVDVNGTPVVFDQPPVTDTRVYKTMVPMRAVLELLDAEISWDNDLNMAGIDIMDNRILVRIGEPFMMLNGIPTDLSTPAIEFNLRTMLPIRDIIEKIGGEVQWNEDTKHIDVTCTND